MRHSPTSHHHFTAIGCALQDATQDEGDGSDHDYAEFDSEHIFLTEPSHSLAVLRDKASAKREAGMQPQKALFNRNIDQSFLSRPLVGERTRAGKTTR